MTAKEIRPAGNGTDRKARQASINCAGIRLCAQCSRPKPLREMAPDHRAKSGYRKICSDC